MSIKFLQDQQLNQIQRSPMDSPWAKLVAQSEMLDRSKLRQPQGQAPQGTVADDIQQALLAAQQNQAQQMQNVPLDKAQLIAQLVNSGHFAAGGLTQSSALEQPNLLNQSSQYSQMLGSSPYSDATKGVSANPMYKPPNSQDAAAQEKKHGILQTLLDNSMYSGKGTIGSNLQMYSDMLTGKLFNRGFAEGGDIQGYARGGTIAEQLEALRPYITGDKGWTPEAIANYKSAYQKQWGTGSSNKFPATTQQLPSYEDLLELQRRRVAQTGLNIRDPNTIEIAPTKQPEIVPRSALMQPEGLSKNVLAQPHNIEALANSPEIQKLLEGPRSSGALPYITQVSESPELQEYYKKLYGPKPKPSIREAYQRLANTIGARGNQQTAIESAVNDLLDTTKNPVSDIAQRMADKGYHGYTRTPPPPDEMLQKMGASFRAQKEDEAARAARAQQEAEAAARAQQEAEGFRGPPTRGESMARKMGYTPPESMTGKMGRSTGYTPPTGDWLGAKPGEKAYKTSPGVVEQGIDAAKRGLGSLVKGAGTVLEHTAVPADIFGVSHELVGNPVPLIYQAITGKKQPDYVASGALPNIVSGVNFNTPAYLTSPVSLTGANEYEDLANLMPNDLQRVADKFKGIFGGAKPNATAPTETPATQTTPTTSTPTTSTPTTSTPTTSTPTTSTPTTSTQTSSVADNTTVNKVAQTTKHPITARNVEDTNNIHNQTPAGATDDLGKKVDATAALQQTIQAVSKSAGEEGQGSILDSLYNKLKDTDVDYSDLAKRISQNEYDLARERKDGAFNAILGGIGAALKQAGTYEEAGGRVFRPGIGAIAGSGILGGLKLSEEADRKYAEGNRDNTLALLKLKELKGKSLNDVLDAISAQQQTQAIARGQEITRAHNAATSAYQMGSLDIDRQNAATNAARATSDEAYKAALIANSTNVMNKQDKFFADELDKEITGLITELTSDKFPDKTSAEYQDKAERLRLARAKKDVLLRKYGLADVEAALGVAGGQLRQNFAKNVTKTPINPGN